MAAIDDRMLQLENFVYELPSLMNARLDGLEGHIRAFRMSFEDHGARLGRVEKILGKLQAQVRDLRNGVMAQLKGQDDRLAAIDGRLGTLEESVAKLDGRQDRIEQRLGSIEGLLGAIAAKLDVRT